MKAMIFAAGLGTRLKPLTGTMPKALVPVGGRPLLEILLKKLERERFDDIVINIHHFADKIEAWMDSKAGTEIRRKGIKVSFSDERKELLETGGGIKRARPLLADCGRVLIHNVDILSNVRLRDFFKSGENAAATLLVSERETQRYLLFDDNMRLMGWTNRKTGEVKSPYPGLNPENYRRLAFAGIHQMSASLFPLMDEWPEKFSIIDFYLSVCATQPIYGYVQPDLRLMDVGKLDTLPEADRFLETVLTD